MGIYVRIEKVLETGTVVRYSFGTGNGKAGMLELRRKDGEVALMEPMLEDEKMHHFERAAVKVFRAWEKGEFPQCLEWAS
jgi:hypothetical protein